MEFRFPYLDRDLVQFVLRMPYRNWPHASTFARLHRAPLADLLPSEVSERFGKAEFTPALENRVRSATPLVESILHDGEWASGDYVDRRLAQRFWRSVSDGRLHVTSLAWRQVWAVATLESWLRKILGYHSVRQEA